MRNIYIIAILLLFFSGYIFSVQKMEHVIADGKTVLLPLAPVDPRALLMGDYMSLSYVVNGKIYSALMDPQKERKAPNRDIPDQGQAVLRISNAPVAGAAEFVRLYNGGPLQDGEFLLSYKLRRHSVLTAASAFYFEEGSAKRYEQARFGLFKVADDGKTLLINLCDSQGRPIEYEKATEKKVQP